MILDGVFLVCEIMRCLHDIMGLKLEPCKKESKAALKPTQKMLCFKQWKQFWGIFISKIQL